MLTPTSYDTQDKKISSEAKKWFSGMLLLIGCKTNKGAMMCKNSVDKITEGVRARGFIRFSKPSKEEWAKVLDKITNSRYACEFINEYKPNKEERKLLKSKGLI